MKNELPGPGLRKGQETNWVRIEKVEVHSVPPDNVFLVQIRPSYDPQIRGSTRTAHFLEDSATSTFIVEREGKMISAIAFGRNEVPNTANSRTTDKQRNAAVGAPGAIGLSKQPWESQR